MIRLGRWDDVLVMTYSEFGRRVAENGSEGTDHGTASMHILLSGQVQPGLYGSYPSLSKLKDGDLIYTMDYRALYERICTKWLGHANNKWLPFADKKLRFLLS